MAREDEPGIGGIGMTNGMPFGARLRAAMELSPLCVGIDPHRSLLRAWGLSEDVAGLERFSYTAAEAFAGTAAVIKPQSAFFERYGSRGIRVLERVIEMCRAGGSLVILDVKRGDIGSTAQEYADGYLDQTSPLAVDAITVSPYLGFGSVTPMIETARRHNAGVFVLALTSNPEAPPLQRAMMASGKTVAEDVLDHLRAENAGSSFLGSFGAVVGATIDKPPCSLAINGPLLVPGIGAQGGSVEDVQRIFSDCLDLVLPTTSREILATGPSVQGLAEAVRSTAAVFADVVRG